MDEFGDFSIDSKSLLLLAGWFCFGKRRSAYRSLLERVDRVGAKIFLFIHASFYILRDTRHCRFQHVLCLAHLRRKLANITDCSLHLHVVRKLLFLHGLRRTWVVGHLSKFCGDILVVYCHRRACLSEFGVGAVWVHVVRLQCCGLFHLLPPGGCWELTHSILLCILEALALRLVIVWAASLHLHILRLFASIEVTFLA